MIVSLALQGAHDATEMLARYSAQQQQFSELQQKKEEKSARLQQLRQEMENLGTNRLGNDPYFGVPCFAIFFTLLSAVRVQSWKGILKSRATACQPRRCWMAAPSP